MAQIIVLPFKCNSLELKTQVGSLLKAGLERQGFQPLADSVVEGCLRRQRIRDTSRLSESEAQALSRELGSPLILLGSAETYTSENSTIEMGCAARLLNSHNGEITWAGCRYANGDNYAGLLGLGRITDPVRLVDRELQTLLSDFRGWWVTHPERIYAEQPAVDSSISFCVIPFDNLSGNSTVSMTVQNSLICALLAKGFRVIEPGMVNEILRENDLRRPGEIDLHSLQALQNCWSKTNCLTGAVYTANTEFLPVLGEVPTLEITLRWLDPHGRVIWMQQQRRTGTDYVKIFDWGLIRSSGQLFHTVITELVDDLPITQDGAEF